MRRFRPCGRFVSIKKNAVRDGTLVLATKNTLCAQRKEAPCMQHAGGTSQLARMLTTQNNSFVQLPSVHPVWCLLYARCAFCAGRKAYVFLGTEPWLRCGRPWFSYCRKPHAFFVAEAIIPPPLPFFVWARFAAIIKYRAWHPLRGRPRSFRLFLSVLLLTGFHSRPTGFCEPPGLLVTFFSASTAGTASVGLQGFW